MTQPCESVPNIARALICVAFALAFTACSKSASTRTEPPALDLTTEARASLERALGTYETIRQYLAQDQFEVSSQAHRLTREVSQASGQVPEAARLLIAPLADAATGLEDAPGDDPQAVRSAFAEVSRAAVALIEADAALGQSRRVYECPMMKGYGRWIQVGGETSNPYMGARMPQCGTVVE